MLKDPNSYRLRKWVLTFSVTAGILSPYKMVENQVRVFCDKYNLECKCYTSGFLVKQKDFVIKGCTNDFMLQAVKDSLADYFKQFEQA